MSDTFLAVILASSLACTVTTIGIYVIGRFEEWGRRKTVYFMSFAAGVLVSVSFIHIIPRSYQMHPEAPVFLLGGFLALYLFNRFLNLYICGRVVSQPALQVVKRMNLIRLEPLEQTQHQHQHGHVARHQQEVFQPAAQGHHCLARFRL